MGKGFEYRNSGEQVVHGRGGRILAEDDNGGDIAITGGRGTNKTSQNEWYAV